MTRQGAASNVEEQREDHESALLSDDECVQKLAALIELRDGRNLGEIAKLIARLAVPVE
jgi:hypothetical protein